VASEILSPRFRDLCPLAPSPHHHTHLSKALVGENPGSGSNQSSRRAHSDDSSSSFSFGAFLYPDSEAGFAKSKSKRSKRLKGDTSTCGSKKSTRLDVEPKSTPGAFLLNDAFTNINMPDIRNNNHELSLADRTQLDVRLNLMRSSIKD
jgi:hypothetical protein